MLAAALHGHAQHFLVRPELPMENAVDLKGLPRRKITKLCNGDAVSMMGASHNGKFIASIRANSESSRTRVHHYVRNVPLEITAGRMTREKGDPPPLLNRPLRAAIGLFAYVGHGASLLAVTQPRWLSFSRAGRGRMCVRVCARASERPLSSTGHNSLIRPLLAANVQAGQRQRLISLLQRLISQGGTASLLGPLVASSGEIILHSGSLRLTRSAYLTKEREPFITHATFLSILAPFSRAGERVSSLKGPLSARAPGRLVHTHTPASADKMPRKRGREEGKCVQFGAQDEKCLASKGRRG